MCPKWTTSVAALLALGLTACGGAKPKPQPSALPSVQTAVARFGTIQPSESLAGIVAPYQNVAVQSSLSEPADEVFVKEGDRVSQGEVLARLDTADLEAELQSDLAQANADAANTTHTVYQGDLTIQQSSQSVRSAAAAVGQAQQTYRKDDTDLQRYEQLLGSGYISEQQVAQQIALVRNDQEAIRSAQATLASAQEQVTANGTLTSDGSGSGLEASSVQQAQAAERVALAQAQQVRTSIAKATISSPINGVVVNRNLNVGEYPGTRQIFTLQQTDPIYAVLRGSGQQIARMQAGAGATITSSDLPGGALHGTVAGVLNQINPGSTDFVVKVVLSNPSGRLRPGMSVQGLVSLPDLRGVRIPATAFTDDDHASVMVVAQDGTVSTVKVSETGEDAKEAVVTGLRPGSRVIVDGQSAIGDGQKVAYR
jgi:multidrug efflux pump subunit AcrA (membrane-fusion protein)